MKLEYADLLSGESIYVENIGNVQSPKLKKIKPKSGIGWDKYALYLNLFAWNKEQLLESVKKLPIRGIRVLEKIPDKFETFDIMILIPQIKKLLAEAMAFFIIDTILWDEKTFAFNVLDKNNNPTGRIDRDNFKDLCEIVLKLNYVGVSKDNMKIKDDSSKTAMSRWEKAQEFLDKQKKSNPEDEEFSLGNIISKLCVVHPSYNLFNVYELTIFQLYDQFFQYCHLHTTDLNERIFSIHGGSNFKGNEWLKNINN